MKALLASGGTGGHFYPGFALGQALRGRGHEVAFLVRRGDPSVGPLEAADLPSVEIDLKGMPRGLGALNPAFALRTWRGFSVVGRAIKAWRPHVVVGMGSYLSLPAVWHAWHIGVPAVIHESNAALGLAHRLSLPFATRIALGLPIAGFSDRRAELTGTPLRPAFDDLPSKAEARARLGFAAEKPLLLVVGGSQGARALNAAVPKALERLAPAARARVQVLHLSGTREFASVEAAYKPLGAGFKALPYMEGVHEAFAAADLVLCRSGAGTIAELVASRKPAILVPYPHATGGHQLLNARALEGAAVVVEEKSLDAARLAGLLENLLHSESGRLVEMARAYAGLNLPDPRQALPRLVRLVEEWSDAQGPSTDIRSR